jgi:transposase-like protein
MECLLCGHHKAHKHGTTSKGNARYECLKCKKTFVDYATYQMNSQLFVQKYQLYLPNREELRREIELTLREVEL